MSEKMTMSASESRYDELNMLLSDPDVMRDPDRYARLMKEYSRLEPLVTDVRRSRELLAEIEDTKMLLTESEDESFRELAREELSSLESELSLCQERIELALVPRDENDDKNVIVEIRAGAGGEEAALFAEVLTRMYQNYAESNGWSIDVIDLNETGIGGYKSIVFEIDGDGAYSRFKFESGVHRVQRVPVTESGGRIHTSTATVAVLPEADAVEIDINPADLEVDTYRASGAGGQHVNKTSSAIRITHLPTGVVVTCQDQRSQHKNREKAMAHLRAILLERERESQESDIASERKNQVGSGDRSERIRTYNYPQGRVTDHRINLTLYRLEAVLNGDLDELIVALQKAEHERLVNAAS
ncbi:MAG TPA: peptide chain release factor 1 [Fastidiosipila sp.]|jgi:peptide chain release factor 1|nr:peptide chain release factor 1 [Fastidiosipila sp.]